MSLTEATTGTVRRRRTGAARRGGAEESAADGRADGEEYVCEVCGERFDSAAALHDHLYSIGLVY